VIEQSETSLFHPIARHKLLTITGVLQGQANLPVWQIVIVAKVLRPEMLACELRQMYFLTRPGRSQNNTSRGHRQRPQVMSQKAFWFGASSINPHGVIAEAIADQTTIWPAMGDISMRPALCRILLWRYWLSCKPYRDAHSLPPAELRPVTRQNQTMIRMQTSIT